VLIVDSGYPDLFSLNQVSIYPDKMIKAVIEVKSKYNGSELIDAIKKLIKIKNKNQDIFTFYYCFDGAFKKVSTPFWGIDRAIDKKVMSSMPNGFCFLNKGYINQISYSNSSSTVKKSKFNDYNMIKVTKKPLALRFV
jgi:hypothetical protein